MAGAGGLFRTTNGGATWSEVRQPLPPVTALLFDRADPRVVFAGTELRGNFRSDGRRPDLAPGQRRAPARPLRGHPGGGAAAAAPGEPGPAVHGRQRLRRGLPQRQRRAQLESPRGGSARGDHPGPGPAPHRARTPWWPSRTRAWPAPPTGAPPGRGPGRSPSRTPRRSSSSPGRGRRCTWPACGGPSSAPPTGAGAGSSCPPWPARCACSAPGPGPAAPVLAAGAGEGLWNLTLFPTLPASPEPAANNRRFFPETSHNVSPTFYPFYLARGGLERFGLPRTEEFSRRGAWCSTSSGGAWSTTRSGATPPTRCRSASWASGWCGSRRSRGRRERGSPCTPGWSRSRAARTCATSRRPGTAPATPSCATGTPATAWTRSASPSPRSCRRTGARCSTSSAGAWSTARKRPGRGTRWRRGPVGDEVLRQRGWLD